MEEHLGRRGQGRFGPGRHALPAPRVPTGAQGHSPSAWQAGSSAPGASGHSGPSGSRAARAQRPGPRCSSPARPGRVGAASAAATGWCAPQGAGHTGAAAWPGGGGQGRAGVRGRRLGGGRSGGPRCQGPAPGCTAEALHPPHTCNATAMHRGAARSPGHHATTCLWSSLPRGPCHTACPAPAPGVGTLRPEGAASLPWTQASARKQGPLAPQLCAAGPTPAVFCSPKGPSREWKGLDPPPPDLPGPQPHPSPCQWSCRLAWRPGCPAGTHWPSHTWPGWLSQTLPSRGPAGPGRP